MNKNIILVVLFFVSTNIFSQDITKVEDAKSNKGHLFSNYKIHDPNFTWTSVVRFLGAKSMFYTAVVPIGRNAVIKPEVLFGNINETTVWYSYNFPLTRKYKIGFFLGPGVSYSFDSGQGARLRWQYGLGTPYISEDIPISLFLLSNVTHDFNADETVWDWFNFGIAYQLNNRVKIQVDMEGNYLGDVYTHTNLGFVVDL